MVYISSLLNKKKMVKKSGQKKRKLLYRINLLTSNLVGGPSHFALSRRLVALAFAARMRASDLRVRAYAVRIRQHTSAYVGKRQHTSACVSIRDSYEICAFSFAYAVRTRQHTRVCSAQSSADSYEVCAFSFALAPMQCAQMSLLC